jgi:hypothetical protein
MKTISAVNLLVVGLVRDCAHTIQAEVARLMGALKCFNSLSWLVIESDSVDGTPSLLAGLNNTIPNFRYVSLGALDNTIPERTTRIAHCRNHYLAELRTNPLYKAIDYIVVADLDGVNSLITSDAVRTCWLRDDWDVCCANQAGPYYDIWALRHRDWSPNDCLKQYKFLLRFRSHHEAVMAAIWLRMITIPQSSDWIEVESAFGGFAIYRKDILLNGTVLYEGDGCEHVTLHSKIREHGGRIFINPRLVNGGENSHTNWARRASHHTLGSS